MLSRLGPPAVVSDGLAAAGATGARLTCSASRWGHLFLGERNSNLSLFLSRLAAANLFMCYSCVSVLATQLLG